MGVKRSQADTKPRPQGGGSQVALVEDARTMRLLRGWAALRATHREAAAGLGVSLSTFEEFMQLPQVRDAWNKAEAEGMISLRRSQFMLAKKQSAMAIHMGKVYLGQKEEVHLNTHVTLEHLIVTSLGKSEDEPGGADG